MSIGAPPPNGSVVHARLVTALSSASAKKGDPVEAVITEPLVVSDHLILPQGSTIKGSVMQVARARRLGRNGQLRILFHQVAPPNGIEQKVETSLEGVAVAKGEHLKLDAEGGAQVTTPETRYLTTGIQVMLAASQAAPGSRCGTRRTELGRRREAGRPAGRRDSSWSAWSWELRRSPEWYRRDSDHTARRCRSIIIFWRGAGTSCIRKIWRW